MNKTLIKVFQKVWSKEWIHLGKELELTDEQAECLANTLIQWKVYNKVNHDKQYLSRKSRCYHSY